MYQIQYFHYLCNSFNILLLNIKGHNSQQVCLEMLEGELWENITNYILMVRN
jgi:hypothetical protein